VGDKKKRGFQYQKKNAKDKGKDGRGRKQKTRGGRRS